MMFTWKLDNLFIVVFIYLFIYMFSTLLMILWLLMEVPPPGGDFLHWYNIEEFWKWTFPVFCY